MKFALHFGNFAFPDPEGARRLVRLAEAAGFDSLASARRSSRLTRRRERANVRQRWAMDKEKAAHFSFRSENKTKQKTDRKFTDVPLPIQDV